MHARAAGAVPVGDELGAAERAPLAREQAAARPSLGHVPVIAVVVSLGLLVCAGADALSRSAHHPSPWLFWTGVAMIAAPIFYRLSSVEASRTERLVLVCLLGMAFYVTKLMRDPSAYTFPDEFFHAFNADDDVARHALWGSNLFLSITPKFPGLEGATSGLMTLTGMSSFGAGILLIGAARLTMMVGLYALFSTVGGSARVGGLAAAIYAGNSNFMLWGVQYSYESLALPLMVVVLAAVAMRSEASGERARALALPTALLIAAVVITHHITSYVLALTLLVLTLLFALLRRRSALTQTWPLTLLATGLALGWLIVVASATVGYVTPAIHSALRDIVHTAAGESAPRAPFQGGKAGPPSTPAERVVSLASVAILAALLPIGLRRALRRYGWNPYVLVFSGAAIAFFGLLGLRLVPHAWEIGNRLGEFVFVGLAFVIACALPRRRFAQWSGRTIPALSAAGFVVVVIGGAIAGWPSAARLAQPVRIAADGHSIDSEPLTLGRWVQRNIQGVRFAAPQIEARTVMVPGRVEAFGPPQLDLTRILTGLTLPPYERQALHYHHVRYLVFDRRRTSSDNTSGYGFSLRHAPDKLFPPQTAAKFDDLPAPRVYDSGNILLYDVGGVR